MRRIVLGGEALRGIAWTPGDKLQIRQGHGLQTRTYTRIEWPPTLGELLFLPKLWRPGLAVRGRHRRRRETRWMSWGRASTVQRLQHRLRAGSLQARRIHTKVYWADGKFAWTKVDAMCTA